MSVNGVEITPGQKWTRRDGSVVTILHADMDPRGFFDCFVIVDTTGALYQANGRFRRDGAHDSKDLVSLHEDNEAKQDPRTSSAPALLEAAAGHMRDRAATYDKPEGERSMAQTVTIFNQFHGTALTEAQGWHFMQILKDVRLFTNITNPHRDSVDDCIAYSALKGEAALKGGGK